METSRKVVSLLAVFALRFLQANRMKIKSPIFQYLTKNTNTKEARTVKRRRKREKSKTRPY